MGGLYLADRKAVSARPDPTALALSRLQQDVVALRSGVDYLRPLADPTRQDETVRQLRKSVDTLKAELDAQRNASAAALTQLSAKLDRPDRDPSPKLGEITARLDRIEKQVSSPAATGTVAAPAKSAAVTVIPQSIATPVATAEKTLPKPSTLDTYVVRDVYDGLALVEGRSGGVREVAPGEYLPGAGEVRSIEKRGRAWVVVTSRGIIDTATW